MVGSRGFLLGLVSQVLHYGPGSAISRMAPSAAASEGAGGQMIDLGIVVKASAILEVIEALLRDQDRL